MIFMYKWVVIVKSRLVPKYVLVILINDLIEYNYC